MRSQEMFDNFILHNFTFKGVTVEDNGPEEIVREGKIGFVEELADLTRQEEAKAVEPKMETVVPPPEETQTTSMPPTIAAMLRNSPNKAVVYCLPGVYQKSKDDFYGEGRKEPVYSDPFTFEGVVVYSDDLSLSVWSPTGEVTVGSVIFPQNRDKRWWRIVSREENMGGWMLHGTISDFQPQFRV